MRESIFSFLKSYIPTEKRDAKEDYLTQMFAWILDYVDGFVDDYVALLHSRNPEIPVETVDASYKEISTQKYVYDGRIDLFIRVNKDLAFVCEHKVFSELSEGQIEKYMEEGQKTFLGDGAIYSVLVTFSAAQHRQDADVRITWGDICEFAEDIVGKYDGEERFLIWQFISYLKENGMGQMEPIRMDALLAYWSACALKENVETMFSSLAGIDWMAECPGIEGLSPDAKLAPTMNRYRWGRVGIDFFETWIPGLFAGVLLDPGDHKLEPADRSKGPELVILIESDYAPRNAEIMKRYDRIKERFAQVNERLEKDSGTFGFLPGIPESCWRISVLRKPLYDVLAGKSAKEEQARAIKDTIAEGINLLIKAYAG